MAECVCLLCGPCKTQAKSAPKNGQPVQKQVALVPAKLPARSLGLADAVVTWVLGEVPQTTGKGTLELQCFSAMNGYHVRTIPGSRWTNPVIVGAGGGGFVVVVDRFGDHDLLRVTDMFGGAGMDSFDSDGFPLPGVDFSKFQDMLTLPTPTGSRCTGVKVLPCGEMLASLTSSAGTVYLKQDLQSLVDGAKTGPVLNGLLTLDRDFGTPIGSACGYDPNPSDDHHNFIGIANGDRGNALFVADYRTGKVQSWVGLPDNPTLIGVAHAKGVVSVLMGESGAGKYIVRLRLTDKTNLASGLHSDKEVSAPDIYPVYHTFQAKDFVLPDMPTDAQIKSYLDAAAQQSSAQTDVTAEITAAVAKAGSWTAPLAQATDSAAASDGRTASLGVMLTGFYGGVKQRIKAQIIPIDPALSLIGLESEYATITELYARKKNGNADDEQIVFRNLHGTHYDWLSEGGWAYGCTQAAADGSSKPLVTTNGITALSHSSDRSPLPGTLKNLPDLKVALVDSLNGLLIYRLPKPIGYTLYGGSYAVPQLVTGSGLQESTCGDAANKIATALDGLNRHNMSPVILTPATPNSFATYVAQWHDSVDYDFPWQFFSRRVSGPAKAMFNLGEESWSIRDDDGGLIPDYQNLANPVGVSQNGPVGSFFYQPFVPWAHQTGSGPDATNETYPALTVQGFGGFINLTLPKEQTTRYIQLEQQIGDVQADVQDKQAHLTNLSAQLAKDEAALTKLGGTDNTDPFGQPLPSNLNNNDLNTQSVLNVPYTPQPGDGIVVGGAEDAAASPKQLQDAQTAVAADKQDQKATNDAITQDEAQLQRLGVELSETAPNDPDNVVFDVLASLKNETFGAMVRSEAQLLDPMKGGNVEIPASPGILAPWQAVPIGEVKTGPRAIVIEPNIRSWVNVQVSLEKWDRPSTFGADGQDGWEQPETRRGLFGQKLHRASAKDFTHFVGELTPGGVYPFCGGIIPGYTYDAGDIANGGAIGQWEIEVRINGKAAPGGFQVVTFPDQITSLAPSDLENILSNTFNANLGAIENPDTNFYSGHVFFGPDLVQRVDVKVRLVNYAFDVYRYGTRTKEYVYTDSHGNMLGYQQNSGPDAGSPGQPGRYGADPGFYWGNDCEAFCFGNVGCAGFIFAGRQLCRDDQPNPLVTNVLWEGNASYVWNQDPYADKGISMGRYLDAYFDFNLNGGVFQYDIDLRHGEGRTGLGACN